MKTFKIFAICAIAAMAMMTVSCNRAATPRTNLRTTADSISYAWGITLSPQLIQILEHEGILQNVSMIEEDFEMRMFTADSLQRIQLARQRRAAVDSVNRLNAPRLNEFIRGMRRAMNEEVGSPYATGLMLGAQLLGMMGHENQMFFGENATESFNSNQVLAGLIQMLRNETTAFSVHEAEEFYNIALHRAQEEQMMRHEENIRIAFADVIAEGAAFLAENAERPEVTVLPSGLQYEIIREGTGPRPTLTDMVRVHYHGTLLDGTVFDSSMDRQRDNPDRDWTAVFPVGNVIAGWIEALQLMPVGSKWILFVPYDLAYGSRDGGIFPPFSTMIFEVELLGIE